ncbi:uncharacterized protein [Paralichthys olivaceus]|uniref:uncharacterized protein n=1 Tax=Paralichthys olivaceus TaxID=8255 RepID=UPI0037507FD0
MTTALRLVCEGIQRHCVGRAGRISSMTDASRRKNGDTHTCETADLTVCGLNEEPSAQEEEEEDEDEQIYRTPERTRSRRPADILLDLSEEAYLKELEPHLFSGVEETICGWERVAPLSCILLTQNKPSEPQQKTADNSTTISADPTPDTADSSASIAVPPGLYDQSWINKAVAALQLDTKKWPSGNAMQKTPSHHLPEMIEEGRTLENTLQPCDVSSKCPVSEKRHIKPQKHSHKPNSIMVPIKNITFLPPLKPPHLNPKVDGQLCRGRKASVGENLQERCFMLDKRSGRRGRRDEPVANAELPNQAADLTSKHQACHHNALLSYAGSFSIPKRYQVPVSSKPDTVHHGRYSMGKSLTQVFHGSSEAGTQTHLQPS